MVDPLRVFDGHEYDELRILDNLVQPMVDSLRVFDELMREAVFDGLADCVVWKYRNFHLPLVEENRQ
jgi:hypothetical protein